MITIKMLASQARVLQNVLKIARKNKVRKTYHNIFILAGAVHATDGKMLVRLDTCEECAKLDDGLYEILKIVKVRGLQDKFALLSVNKLDEASPLVDMLFNRPQVSGYVKIVINKDKLMLTKTVIDVFTKLHLACNYMYFDALAQLDCVFTAHVIANDIHNKEMPILKLTSDGITILIMPFKYNNEN